VKLSSPVPFRLGLGRRVERVGDLLHGEPLRAARCGLCGPNKVCGSGGDESATRGPGVRASFDLIDSVELSCVLGEMPRPFTLRTSANARREDKDVSKNGRRFRDTEPRAVWAPRASQELALRVPVVTDELSQQLGRTATYADLTDQLHGSVDDVATVGAWWNYHLQSLNPPATAGSDDFIDVIGDNDPGYVPCRGPSGSSALCRRAAVRAWRILTMRFHAT
jgi:hypothetical protein